MTISERVPVRIMSDVLVVAIWKRSMYGRAGQKVLAKSPDGAIKQMRKDIRREYGDVVDIPPDLANYPKYRNPGESDENKL